MRAAGAHARRSPWHTVERNASLRGGPKRPAFRCSRSPSRTARSWPRRSRSSRAECWEDRRRRRHGALSGPKQGQYEGASAWRRRRRSHPAQHDSRGRQPALAVRRDRVGAGVRRTPPIISGPGHGGYRVALRERRSAPSCCPTPRRRTGAGAHVGKIAFSGMGTPTATTATCRRNLRLAVDSHDAPPRYPTAADQSWHKALARASSSSVADRWNADRALRRGDSRQGNAARQRARRIAELARGRRDRRGGEVGLRRAYDWAMMWRGRCGLAAR